MFGLWRHPGFCAKVLRSARSMPPHPSGLRPDLSGVAALERIWVGLRGADNLPFSLASLFGLIKHPRYIVEPGGLRTRDRCESAVRTHRRNAKFLSTSWRQIGNHGQWISACHPAPRSRRSWQAPQYRACFHPWRSTAVSSRWMAQLRPTRQCAWLWSLAYRGSSSCQPATPALCRSRPEQSIGKALHAITLMITWQFMHELEAIAREIVVRPGAFNSPFVISSSDFTVLLQLIEW